ncbi:MAG: S8 family serine peptidase, partial [Calditrichae bacterium]|nr:S8 family serine peptidase [Calditrichia bacterium]
MVNIWATGAVNGHNPSFPIASFSSRGPSTCGGTGSLLIKPEACAPGVSVRSSQFNNQYGTLSGTSMACPHVVGAIALLKQAFPQFTGHQLKLALYNSAQDLGASGEDNTYGMGIIDVYAAFQSLGVPNPPTNFTSYSDYTMPNSIQ